MSRGGRLPDYLGALSPAAPRDKKRGIVPSGTETTDGVCDTWHRSRIVPAWTQGGGQVALFHYDSKGRPYVEARRPSAKATAGGPRERRVMLHRSVMSATL